MEPIDYLLEEIQEKHSQIARCLVNGGASDFAEYRFLCGQARGLLAAQVLIEDLKTNLEQNDD